MSKLQEKWDGLIIDDDGVEILDWIFSHFQDGNFHKLYEVTVTLREQDIDEDGNFHYVDEKGEEQ